MRRGLALRGNWRRRRGRRRAWRRRLGGGEGGGGLGGGGLGGGGLGGGGDGLCEGFIHALICDPDGSSKWLTPVVSFEVNWHAPVGTCTEKPRHVAHLVASIAALVGREQVDKRREHVGLQRQRAVSDVVVYVTDVIGAVGGVRRQRRRWRRRAGKRSHLDRTIRHRTESGCRLQVARRSNHDDAVAAVDHVLRKIREALKVRIVDRARSSLGLHSGR